MTDKAGPAAAETGEGKLEIAMKPFNTDPETGNETAKNPDERVHLPKGMSNDLGPASLKDFKRLRDGKKFKKAWKQI